MDNNLSLQALAEYFSTLRPEQQLDFYEQLQDYRPQNYQPSPRQLGSLANQLFQRDPYLMQLQEYYLNNNYWR